MMGLSIPSKVANPFRRNHLLRDASLKALYDAMAEDSSVHLFGEGAHVKVHYDAPQIEAEFMDRVHTMPISEDGNTNFAVGTSLLGVKPVVDVISADFLYRTMDSICNTAAKLNFVLGPNRQPSTIVIRAEFLIGGPTTGQRPEALFTHIPGLRVVIPSTPHDAYGLMRTALASPGITLYFEDRMIEDSEEWTEEDLQTDEAVPFGSLMIRREGQRGTATIITYGVMRQQVEAILRPWGKGDPYRLPNLDCRVVDLPSIYPIDFQVLRSACQRARDVLIIEPDVCYGGVGAEIAAQLSDGPDYYRVHRLGAKRMTIPACMTLHADMLPTEEEIVNAITAITDWTRT